MAVRSAAQRTVRISGLFLRALERMVSNTVLIVVPAYAGIMLSTLSVHSRFVIVVPTDYTPILCIAP